MDGVYEKCERLFGGVTDDGTRVHLLERQPVNAHFLAEDAARERVDEIFAFECENLPETLQPTTTKEEIRRRTDSNGYQEGPLVTAGFRHGIYLQQRVLNKHGQSANASKQFTAFWATRVESNTFDAATGTCTLTNIQLNEKGLVLVDVENTASDILEYRTVIQFAQDLQGLVVQQIGWFTFALIPNTEAFIEKLESKCAGRARAGNRSARILQLNLNVRILGVVDVQRSQLFRSLEYSRQSTPKPETDAQHIVYDDASSSYNSQIEWIGKACSPCLGGKDDRKPSPKTVKQNAVAEVQPSEILEFLCRRFSVRKIKKALDNLFEKYKKPDTVQFNTTRPGTSIYQQDFTHQRDPIFGKSTQRYTRCAESDKTKHVPDNLSEFSEGSVSLYSTGRSSVKVSTRWSANENSPTAQKQRTGETLQCMNHKASDMSNCSKQPQETTTEMSLSTTNSDDERGWDLKQERTLPEPTIPQTKRTILPLKKTRIRDNVMQPDDYCDTAMKQSEPISFRGSERMLAASNRLVSSSSDGNQTKERHASAFPSSSMLDRIEKSTTVNRKIAVIVADDQNGSEAVTLLRRRSYDAHFLNTVTDVKSKCRTKDLEVAVMRPKTWIDLTHELRSIFGDVIQLCEMHKNEDYVSGKQNVHTRPETSTCHRMKLQNSSERRGRSISTEKSFSSESDSTIEINIIADSQNSFEFSIGVSNEERRAVIMFLNTLDDCVHFLPLDDAQKPVLAQQGLETSLTNASFVSYTIKVEEWLKKQAKILAYDNWTDGDIRVFFMIHQVLYAAFMIPLLGPLQSQHYLKETIGEYTCQEDATVLRTASEKIEARIEDLIKTSVSTQRNRCYEALVKRLITFETSEHVHIIVCVKERTMVAALARRLENEERVQNWLNVSCLGTKTHTVWKHPQATRMAPKVQQETIARFRDVHKGLLLMTPPYRELEGVETVDLILFFGTPKSCSTEGLDPKYSETILSTFV